MTVDKVISLRKAHCVPSAPIAVDALLVDDSIYSIRRATPRPAVRIEANTCQRSKICRADLPNNSPELAIEGSSTERFISK